MSRISIGLKDIASNWEQSVINHKTDIYHRCGWVRASSLIEKGTPKIISANFEDKKVFIPVIVRNIDAVYWDAISTYGYGGPLIDPKLTCDEVDAIFKEIQQFLYLNNCVSLFLRLHPILNFNWNVKIGSTVTHGPTLVSDLTKDESEHWSETQNQHRRGIRKALKAGITTRCERFDGSNIDTFLKIYTETMVSVNAHDFYFFDREYFGNLAKNLPNSLLLITAYDDELAVASSLYTTDDSSKIIQYHLGGTLNSYRKLQPSKLITHVARDWGRKNNYHFLHLGGGVGANLDSLYYYKKGFSSYELDFQTYRMITNSDIYNELTKLAGNENSNSTFFPLYRK